MNLRFLQKALRFLGIPRTLILDLAHVGATISTVPQWATVKMAAPTWARDGPHPACVRAHVQVGAALSVEIIDS